MPVQESVGAKQLSPSCKHTMNPTTFDTKSSYTKEEFDDRGKHAPRWEGHREGWTERLRTNKPLENRGRRAQYYHGNMGT